MPDSSNTKLNLRFIPSVDRVLNVLDLGDKGEDWPHWLLLKTIRQVLDTYRAEAVKIGSSPDREKILYDIVERVRERLADAQQNRLRRVINATGVIVHTNLGRAPLASEAIKEIVNIARGYSNLEYDIDLGRRGKRDVHVKEIILRLTGAEDAFVVNNNAGAVFLVLNSLAEGREVIVSRGELVEIGGSFRIPDVMGKSCAIMREIGTTNRTHLSDYEDAITDRTALLLKVHTSNYRITGFSAEVSLRDLVELGKRHGLPVMIDLGSGNLTDLSPLGLRSEPTIPQILSTGVDVITFSGDKLLGGPQAGVILTQGDISMDTIRKNPLARALRIDKLTLAALEATLLIYQKKGPSSAIPVLRMMSLGLEQIRERAQGCLSALYEINDGFMDLMILEGEASVGGGSLPTQTLPTCLIGFRGGRISVDQLESLFRSADPAVIGRIQDETFMLDFRTIDEPEIAEIIEIYRDILKKKD